MGRKRRRNKHLPRRMYLRAGGYYLVDHAGHWHNLGRDYTRALAAYGQLTETTGAVSTMADVIERYVREISPTLSADSYRSDKTAAKFLLAYFGRMHPRDVTAQTIYGYLDERSKVARVRPNRELSLLSMCCQRAIRWGVLTENPCRDVERLPEPPRTRDLTPAELDAFIVFCAEHGGYNGPLLAHYCVLKFLTGLRRRDILGMRIDQLKDDGIHVTPSKTKKTTGQRLIFAWTPALRSTVDTLRSMGRIGSLYVVHDRRGHQVNVHTFRTAWDRARAAALGKGVLAQGFWDTDIRAATAGDAATLERASEILGHASSETTRRHYRRRPQKVTPIR